jgi:hypothetical protein
MDIDTQHGLKSILISLVGIILTYLLKDIVKGIYAFKTRNQRPTREEFKELTQALNAHTEALQKQKHMTDKMALDIKRIYLFLKIIAGHQWPEYRKEVKEMEELES